MYSVGQVFEKAFPIDAATWCDENGATIEAISPIGDTPRYQIVSLPEPTEEEVHGHLQEHMTYAVQRYLDAFAQTRGYDGIMSACSYSNSTDAQFKLEADYCIQLRDTTWRMGYAILAEVKAGNRPVPTVEELIAELPVGSAKWPDEQ